MGTGTDNTGCLEEAVARIKKNGSLGDQIKAGLFLDYCLKSSKPSPGFCDDVPPADEIMKSVAWRIQMSRKYNLDGTRANILQSMEKYCDECRKKTK